MKHSSGHFERKDRDGNYRENCQQDTTVKHRSGARRSKCKDDLLCSFDNAFRPLGRSKCCATEISMATTYRPIRVTDACAIFLSRASAAIARGRGADHHARSTRFFFRLRWACSQRFLQIAVKKKKKTAKHGNRVCCITLCNESSGKNLKKKR